MHIRTTLKSSYDDMMHSYRLEMVREYFPVDPLQALDITLPFEFVPILRYSAVQYLDESSIRALPSRGGYRSTMSRKLRELRAEIMRKRMQNARVNEGTQVV